MDGFRQREAEMQAQHQNQLDEERRALREQATFVVGEHENAALAAQQAAQTAAQANQQLQGALIEGRSARNEIMAPRIFDYQRPGGVNTPKQARAWVQEAAIEGIDGMKLGAFRPEIMGALLDEGKKVGLGSTAHLAQSGVAQMNAIDAARLGLGTVTHFYGHFESLLND